MLPRAFFVGVSRPGTQVEYPPVVVTVGTGNEFLSATTSSSTGDICVSGRWANLATTDIGGITLTNSDSGASDEVLVAKMDKDGDVKWAKSWGNANEAERAVTAFDSSGQTPIYLLLPRWSGSGASESCYRAHIINFLCIL